MTVSTRIKHLLSKSGHNHLFEMTHDTFKMFILSSTIIFLFHPTCVNVRKCIGTKFVVKFNRFNHRFFILPPAFQFLNSLF